MPLCAFDIARALEFALEWDAVIAGAEKNSSDEMMIFRLREENGFRHHRPSHLAEVWDLRRRRYDTHRLRRDAGLSGSCASRLRHCLTQGSGLE